MNGRSILVTGAAGYLGSLLVEELSRSPELARAGGVIAMDVREVGPAEKKDRVTYLKQDIRGGDLTRIFREYGVDTVVHLASIVTPGKKSDREFEYSVDVLGTEAVLRACRESAVKKIIVASSGAAYGYHADNPP